VIFLLYIILLFVVISIGYAYLSAKERYDIAKDVGTERKITAMKKKFADTDGIVYPSWMNDDEFVQAFETGIINSANKKGIPTPFVLEGLKNIEYRNETYKGAWAMEESGFTFEEQTAIASEVLIKQWYAIPYSQRHAIINKE